MKGLIFSQLKLFTGTLIIVLILSCKTSDEIKIGTYEYYRPSKIELGFRYIFQGVNGIHCMVKQLTINKDSTFSNEFSSEIKTGNWKYLNDSLYLNVKDIIYTDGNLKNYMQEKPLPSYFEPIVYKVNGNNLIRITGIKHHKAISKLKFNAP